MNILLIEDEAPAARRLQSLLQECDPGIQVLSVIDSVDASVKWLQGNPHPDLIFMDIQLADGLSFEIFNKAKISAPVIFTTAYDEYSIKAFKVNGIDYLLKPLEKEELHKSLHKFKTLQNHFANTCPDVDIQALINSLADLKKNYRSRFLVKLGDRLISVETENIAYFTTDEKLTFLVTSENKKYPLDFSLDELDPMLNPQNFFRLNRQYLANIQSIKNISNYFNGKLKILLLPETHREVLVSREKSSAFKEWLNT